MPPAKPISVPALGKPVLPSSAAPSAASDADAAALAHAAELMFFAYRDFIAEPDRILAPLGLGRAHHRLLHFVARSPGIAIADLLEILQITKQSLARVLRDMMIGGYIAAERGQRDKRQRLLYATARGRALYEALSRSQHRRVMRARTQCGGAGFAAWRDFMQAMCNPPPK